MGEGSGAPNAQRTIIYIYIYIYIYICYPRNYSVFKRIQGVFN